MSSIVFKSQHNLFNIVLPDNWEYSLEKNTYTFFCPDEIEGALQISAYHSDQASNFDPIKELAKEKSKYSSAEIIDLSNLKTIHYALEDQQEKLIYYYWITGSAQTKILCSLIINSQQESFKIDKAYEVVYNILSTLKVSSPQ